MKIRNEEMRGNLLSLAVRSALAAMLAAPLGVMAAEVTEDDVAAIRRPTNYVEVGAGNVSEASAKFGEYSGLNEDGTNAVINFSVRGGDAYDGGDGTYRWSITGADLGTTSREFGVAVGSQGAWNLSIGRDEMRHTITDTYQTPQQGEMGGNTFTLPADFGAFVAQTAPSARSLTATQLAAFHTEDVGTTRKNTSISAGIDLTRQLTLKADYNRLTQSGAKLIGGAAIGMPAPTGTWRAEAVAVLMNPTNYQTDTFSLALNWAGENGHVNAAYRASIFQDGYDRLTYDNPMLSTGGASTPGVYQTITLGTAPGNRLHQLDLTGGYRFSPATKLVGGLSYGRNTQNDDFLTGLPEIVVAPRSSLDGRVVTKHADAKLTNQATENLMLTAAVKYNERDNRTPSNQYQYYDISGGPGVAGALVDLAANAPYSNRKTAVELAGDYRLDKSQSIRLGYDGEKIKRWCNDYALAANCLVSPTSDENKVGARYKAKVGDATVFNVAYSRADRKSTFDGNAVTPLAGLNTLTPNDVNAQDYPGFYAVTYARRKQDTVKIGTNWSADEKLEFGIDGRYVNDKYPDSTLGVQKGQRKALNLDTTYTYSDDGSVSAYVSWYSGNREMQIGATGGTPAADNTAASYDLLVAPTNIWSNSLEEQGNAVGLSAKQNLLGGKLQLAGNVSYSFDKSRYSTEVPYLATCGAAGTLSCGTLPDIKSKLLSVKVSGIYDLDKSSKVSVAYLYQKLESEDYFYNWYQYGYTGLRGMPTNQVAPNYSVNYVAASYIYNFK